MVMVDRITGVWMLDPDGYTVVIASPDGTADGNGFLRQ